MITQFTNDGYYVNTGKFFPRIVSDFRGTTDYVVQGGSPNPNGTGTSGQPGTPFANENFQQLALHRHRSTRDGQQPAARDSNDTQFFITTGSLNAELGYDYTIFGQMVTGQTTLATDDPDSGHAEHRSYRTTEVSQPVNPLDDHLGDPAPRPTPTAFCILDTTQATAGRDLDDHGHRDRQR